jgi:hypothetical protein
MPVAATWPTPSTAVVVNAAQLGLEVVVATARPTRVAPELGETATVVSLLLLLLRLLWLLFRIDPTVTKLHRHSLYYLLVLESNWC